MLRWRSTWNSIKDFIVRYPAVLSGYVIYSYLFLCILRFFILVKAGEATALRTYETFVALPFLWLLALALVKVIDIRTRLHDSETRIIQAHQDLENKHLQLVTLKEVIRGVQDTVNNPLGVVFTKTDVIAEAAPDDPTIQTAVNDIKGSVKQIAGALAAFNATEEYHVKHLPGGLGDFAVPSIDDTDRRAG